MEHLDELLFGRSKPIVRSSVHLFHATYAGKVEYWRIGDCNAQFLKTPPQCQDQPAAHHNGAYLTEPISPVKHIRSPAPQTSIIFEIVSHP